MNTPPVPSKRIGFISTRISGSDGVSLEIGKWAEILEEMGHTCHYIAGICDRPRPRTQIISEAHFLHPEIAEINRLCFGREFRSPEISAQIHELTWIIKEKLHSALQKLEIDLLIAENCVTIPMNIPLGLAVVETVIETGLACIAHHHDFVWERERFIVNAVDDYLRAAFPPSLPHMQHVVINSQAAREFSRRTGLPCRNIPNVMDFDRPPSNGTDGARLRAVLGLAPDDYLILQPTRIVPRKGIEHSIELIRRLNDPRYKLVITHSGGDEGPDYPQRVRQYAELLGVPVIFAEKHFSFQPQAGQEQFSIWDAYRYADLISYPSSYEGFGNAFLEAVYFRKPMLCNRYAIYRTDIEPCGFQVVLMDGYLTDRVVEEVRRVVEDHEYRQSVVDHNYLLARQFFSFEAARAQLHAILAKPRLAQSVSAAPGN